MSDRKRSYRKPRIRRYANAQDEAEALIRMWQTGFSSGQIGDYLGISGNAVLQRVDRYKKQGIELVSRGSARGKSLDTERLKRAAELDSDDLKAFLIENPDVGQMVESQLGAVKKALTHNLLAKAQRERERREEDGDDS